MKRPEATQLTAEAKAITFSTVCTQWGVVFNMDKFISGKKFEVSLN